MLSIVDWGPRTPIIITLMTSLVDWGPENSHLPVHIAHTDQPGPHGACQHQQEICQIEEYDFHDGRARHVAMDQIGWTTD